MNRRYFQRQLWAVMAGLGMGLMAAAPAVQAQSSKPVSLVVGYAPGGSADFVARLVGEEMSKELKRQVIIENVAGASGMLAAQKVLNAPADGHMIYMGGTDTVVVPMVNAKVKVNWSQDFQPIGRVTTLPMVFAVPAKSPHNTLSDLLKELRKGGKDFSYATPGIGTMQHLYGELINQRGKVSMLHIPYKGGAQVANDLIGAQIDSAMLVLSTAMPFIKDGKIKVLSVSDEKPVPQVSGVKRIGEEEGFAGMALPLWQGFFVKTGTPNDVVAAYEKALKSALSQTGVVQKLENSGVTAAFLGGKDLTEFIKPQADLYRSIVAASKITTAE